MILFTITLKAQSFSLSGYLSDQNSKQAIEYATIRNINHHTGYYSDKDGYFVVQSSIGDTLIISSIGYKTDSIIIENKNVLDHKMVVEPIKLEAVELTTSDEDIEIGFKKYNNNYEFGIGIEGCEYATYISASEQSKFKTIKQVKFVKKKKGTGRFRLHLYTVGSDGKPHKELLPVNITIDGSQFKKELVFNIESYNISLPSTGVFVSIECLDNRTSGEMQENGIFFRMSSSEEDVNIYLRNVFLNIDWNDSLRNKQNMCVTIVL